MTQGVKAAMAALLIVLATIGGYAWWQHHQAEEAERQIGLDATRIVDEVFNAKRDLRVGQLAGIVIAKSEYKGPVFNTTQQTRAPVTVNYLLDLRKVGRGDYSWNGETKVMTVRIPDITVERPSIDMTKAEVLQNGFWISRQAGIAMQRVAAQRIAIRANERARSQENLAKVRLSALDGVRQLVERPLAAAGVRDVRVAVGFASDPINSRERWDTSRALQDVLGNAN